MKCYVCSPASRVGEEALTVEDTGVLGEEAEDQTCHEVVHFVPLRLA